MRQLTNPMLNRKLQNIINKEMRCRDSYYMTVNGLKIESVPPTLSLLMIITGIIQHILSDGISLKLFVDLGMFLRRIGDKVDYVLLQSQLKSLGMQTMANIIGSIMINVFHFDTDELPFMTKINQTLNIPGTEIPPLPAVSPRDLLSLRAAVEAGADIVAHSFVRSAADVLAVSCQTPEAPRIKNG